MSFFGDIIHKEKLFALVAVNSGSVSGLLMRVQTGKKPLILMSYKQKADISPSLKPDFLRREMERNLENVLKSLSKRAGPKGADKAFFIFSAPWYAGLSRLVELSGEKNIEITPELINKLKKKEMSDLKKQAKKYFSASEKDIQFIEKEPTKFVLNGYELQEPFNKKPKTFKFYLYFGVVQRKIIKKIGNISNKFLKTSSAKFHSVPFVCFDILRDIFGLKENFIFVDLSEEATEIILSRNGRIEEIASFGLGSNFFIRRLASSLNLPLPEAVSFFGQYDEKQIEEKERQKFDGILKEAISKWSSLFNESLEGMGKSFFLPQKIFFLEGGGEFLFRSFQNIVKENHFSKLSSNPKVIKITSSGLKNYFSLSKAETPKNVLTLLFALFINKRERM